jgi:hypothetical protein
LYAADECPFFFPGLAVTLFGTRVGNSRVRTRLTVRLPGDEFGGVITYPKNDLFERRVQRNVCLELDRWLKKLREQKSSLPDRPPGGRESKLGLRLTERMSALFNRIALEIDRRFPPLGETDRSHTH